MGFSLMNNISIRETISSEKTENVMPLPTGNAPAPGL
jgi:hypothetical protein